MANYADNQKTQLLLKLPDVVKAVSLSKASIYKLISKGKFPKPLKLSTRSVAWHIDDLNAWIDALPKGGE